MINTGLAFSTFTPGEEYDSLLVRCQSVQNKSGVYPPTYLLYIWSLPMHAYLTLSRSECSSTLSGMYLSSYHNPEGGRQVDGTGAEELNN